MILSQMDSFWDYMVPEYVPVGRVKGCGLLVYLAEIIPADLPLETDERSKMRFQPEQDSPWLPNAAGNLADGILMGISLPIPAWSDASAFLWFTSFTA